MSDRHSMVARIPTGLSAPAPGGYIASQPASHETILLGFVTQPSGLQHIQFGLPHGSIIGLTARVGRLTGPAAAV